MSLFLLVLLWLLTFVLGRARQSRSFKYSRWIPGMLFFRVSLSAAILMRLLLLFEQQGDALIWLRLVESGALYVALVEVFLDVLWLVLAKLSRRRVSPPRILKDLLLVAAAMVIVAVQLQSQGLLTTLGSAAVLGGLAFVVGPALHRKSAIFHRLSHFKLSGNFQSVIGSKLMVLLDVLKLCLGIALICMTIRRIELLSCQTLSLTLEK